MGSVDPYTTKDGKRYRVRYRRPDGTQTDKRGFETKRGAMLFLSSVEVSKARGEYIDEAAARARIGELGTAWLRDRERLVKPSYYRTLESSWRMHVAPRWGARAIGDIRHSDVQTWISELTKTLSASSVLRAHGILAGILDTAVRDRKIGHNVARNVIAPRKARKKMRAYLTHPQVDLLADSSIEPTMVRFLAYTGLRWGEASGLRVRNLDLTRRRALIEDNAVLINNTIVIGTPKTHHARTIPIPAFLIPELALIARLRQPHEFVFGTGPTPMRNPNSRDGWFAGAVRRAQAIDITLPKVTPHDLRHTAASLAVSAGANVKTIQRMLGHASAAMTLDVYSDLFDSDLDTVSDALSEARADAQLSSGPRPRLPNGASSLHG